MKQYAMYTGVDGWESARSNMVTEGNDMQEKLPPKYLNIIMNEGLHILISEG
jgi:hypothetical protein